MGYKPYNDNHFVFADFVIAATAVAYLRHRAAIVIADVVVATYRCHYCCIQTSFSGISGSSVACSYRIFGKLNFWVRANCVCGNESHSMLFQRVSGVFDCALLFSSFLFFAAIMLGLIKNGFATLSDNNSRSICKHTFVLCGFECANPCFSVTFCQKIL